MVPAYDPCVANESVPPRPIAARDIVAAYSDDLGEWTAAQITDIDPSWKTVGVLELDWSGEEPASVADLGTMRPLALSHHAHTGRLSHTNYDWLLPRGFKRIGSADLLHEQKSNSYGAGWRIGYQLAAQRRWDSGDRSPSAGVKTFSETEFREAAAVGATAELWDVKITDIDNLDCGDLVAAIPGVRRLTLDGNLGNLNNAAELNGLSQLRWLAIEDLFGMTTDDCLLSDSAQELQFLGLYSVPAEYATAMKRAWKPEVLNGTSVEIRGPRKPEWVAENRDNPLRDWDGREHISGARYRKAVSHYKDARRAVIALLSSRGVDQAGLIEIGQDFAEAFNRLDGKRSPFIETEEREELFAALDAAVAAAELEAGQEFRSARDHLYEGVERVRSW